MKRISSPRSPTVGTALCLFLAGVVYPPALAAETAEDVLASMTEARRAIRNVAYSIVRQYRYVKAVYCDEHDEHDGRGRTKEVIVPPGTRTMHYGRVVFSGRKYLYDTEGVTPSLVRGQHGLVPFEQSLAYDGKERRCYFPRNNLGTIEPGPGLDSFGGVLRPLMEFHYGLLTVSRDTEALQFAGKRDWQGRSCYVLSEEIGPWRIEYYIAPKAGWSLVRETREVIAPAKRVIRDEQSGMVTYFSLSESELEMSYAVHSSGAWLPARWTLKHYDGGGPDRELNFVSTVVVTVTDLNAEVPDSTFTLEFPAGTQISDHSVGKTRDGDPAPGRD